MRASAQLIAVIGLLLSMQAGALDASAERAARRIEALRIEHGVAAASVLLVDHEGLLLQRTTGIADLATGRPAGNETRFRVGSITKAFTGLALLRAQARGLLRLDQPVADFLPRSTFDNPWEATTPLRIANLMEHSAGWFDMSKPEFDSSDPTPISLDHALALHPESRRSHWPPGLHHEYSNSGPGLASRVIEQVCRCAFEDFAKREVFEPLGMHSASLIADPETLQRLARGYDTDGKTPIPYWHILYRAAGGLNLDPRDMAPFLRMLLNRGRIGERAFLALADIARFEHPQTTAAAQHGLDFGYGLGVRQYQHHGRSLWGHGGDADGYLAQFAYSPDGGRAYFVVINAFKDSAIDAMQSALDDWLIESMPPSQAPAVAPLPVERLRALSGRYLAATTRLDGPGWEHRSLEVGLRDGALYTRLDDAAEEPLLAIDETRFRRPWETVATTIFIVQPDGRLLLQGPMGNWHRSADFPVPRKTP